MQDLVAKLQAIDDRLRVLEVDTSEESSISVINSQAYDQQQMVEFQEAFSAFDTSGSGTIDADELASALKLIGMFPTAEELQELIDEVDDNKNGVIDFNEFVALVGKVDLLGDQEEESLDGKKKPKKKKTKAGLKLKKLSHYGRDTLLRWITDDPDENEGDVTGPAIWSVRRRARRTMMNRKVENFVYFVITLAAIMSGVQTIQSISDHIVIKICEFTILLIFAVEILVKMVAESRGKFYHFFKDGWNIFDFTILATLLIMTPIVGSEFDGLRILRLLRALRVLKATRVFPKLGLVVETLIASASSVAYIALFMLLISYIFAIIGVSTFRVNDPFHFGSLGVAILSLVRIATLEDWTDIMYFNIYGCDNWGDYSGATGGVLCESEANPWSSVLYFSAFVTISSFLMLNLFIGVVTTSMASAKDEMYARKKEQAKIAVEQRLKAKKNRTSAASTDDSSPKDEDGTILLQNPIFREDSK